MRKLFALILFVAILSCTTAATTVTAVAAAGTPQPALAFTANDSPNVLIAPVQGPSVTKQLQSRAKSSWPWYITRAAGFVAAVSLVLLMLSGIGFITGATFRFLEPLTAWATHKAIAYVFGISVVIHVVTLLFDTYVPFTIAQVLIPFLSPYHQITIAGYQLGSLYVALGVFALYFVLAIIVSSILWIDKKPHTWKLLHFLSYLTMIFVFFHALYLGTDLTHGIFRILWVVFGVAVAVGIVFRMRRRVSAK